ncbi:unnamed protein product [Amoebophrya sp. A25]|nr:unnamed protein product [Amoebophrya sp. A25]|eukprot:GSA25T00016276001.1
MQGGAGEMERGWVVFGIAIGSSSNFCHMSWLCFCCFVLAARTPSEKLVLVASISRIASPHNSSNTSHV